MHVVRDLPRGLDEVPTLCLSPTLESRPEDAKHVLFTARNVGVKAVRDPRSGELESSSTIL